ARPRLRTVAPAGAAAGAPLGVLPTFSFRPGDGDHEGHEGAVRPLFALREGDDSPGASGAGSGSGSAGAGTGAGPSGTGNGEGSSGTGSASGSGGTGSGGTGSASGS
ncbi:hypothetical protein G3I76_26280, partial [Streptomyces sp. SID11233]|nr:hypothetical protein [Streptomyces sp. SID11233]